MVFYYAGTVYDMPLTMQNLFEAGWKTENWQEMEIIEGNTETSSLWLKHTSKDTMTATAYNENPNAIHLEEGIITSLSFFNQAYCILPGNIITGWSTRKEVTDCYGMPDDTDEGTLLYLLDGSAYMWLYFDENAYLIGFQYHSKKDTS